MQEINFTVLKDMCNFLRQFDCICFRKINSGILSIYLIVNNENMKN